MVDLRGPDFLCIGMQKAGTDWLYDQLQFHPDFWMPPVKEIRYLSSKPAKIPRANAFLRMPPERLQIVLSHRRPWDDRDHSFLQEASELRGALDLERYAALFRHKENLISGDVTPAYSTVDEATIGTVNRELPGTKIVLLVREPVSRAWSQISMAYRHHNFDKAVLDEPSTFATFLSNSVLIGERSFPTRILERWRRCGPDLPTGWFLFDDIAQRPAQARASILRFLGADPEKKSGTLEPGYNRKSKHAKLELSEENRAVLVDFFRDELKLCAKVFGGPAEGWPATYGIDV